MTHPPERSLASMAKRKQPCPPKSTALLGGTLPGQLHHALTWALDTRLFADLTVHGNTTWTFPPFILLTLFWVWSDSPTLTTAFAHASGLCIKLLGTAVFTSYTGFIAALTTWTPALIPRMWQCLHNRMEHVSGKHWRVGQWLPLAVDGSRTTTPRTAANERTLCPPRYGQGRTAKSGKSRKNKRRRCKRLGQPVAPQVWLTLLWHMGMRMPWAWKCGPSFASERHHFQELLQTQQFPDKTLFCGDAGFVGYDLWTTMADRGHHFLIRVGGNVRLLKRLGGGRVHDDFVYCWPNEAARKKQPPLRLRLLKFRSGRGTVYAVTNVLSPRKLSDAQAAQLYRARWGVEVQFRTLKQTFGRRKLHSRTPEHAYAELEWSLLGLALIQLLATAQQIPQGISPERTSVSLAVRVFQDAISRGHTMRLSKALEAAVKDPYQRRGSKAARYRPVNKDKPAAGQPKLVNATAEQRRNYRLLNDLETLLTA
jgi:hypothetical protein